MTHPSPYRNLRYVRKKRTNPGRKKLNKAVATTDVIVNCRGSEVGAGESAGRMPVLIPQSHGGALLSGGTPGQKGGGSTPDALRGTIRRILEEHGLPFLQAALSATKTMPCPHCKGEIEVPSDPKLMAKLLDTGLRVAIGSPVQVEHQAVVVVVDGDSLSV